MNIQQFVKYINFWIMFWKFPDYFDIENYDPILSIPKN